MNLTINLIAIVARVTLGIVFVGLGIAKLLDPIEFLKQLYAYRILPEGILINLAAATLPWIEVMLGLLLLTGILIRESALICLVLLCIFTAAVTLRAVDIHEIRGIEWCAIRFDCGCGTGEIGFCNKVIENFILLTCSFICLIRPTKWPFGIRF